MIETRLLKYFLAIAREQSITRAAESLFLSQPTLSRQMKELEEELGVQLFVRGKRQTLLTEEGVYLRARAQEMMQLMEKTETTLKNSGNVVAGDIYVGYGESPAVAPLMRIYDELHLGLAALWDAMLLAMRASEALMVGITTAGDDDSLLLIRLYEEGEAAIEGADERFGFFCWEAEDDELTESNVIRANPSIACGRVSLEVAMSDAAKMLKDTRKGPDGLTGPQRVKRYTLNRFIEGAADTALSVSAWRNTTGDVDHGPSVVYGIERDPTWRASSLPRQPRPRAPPRRLQDPGTSRRQPRVCLGLGHPQGAREGPQGPRIRGMGARSRRDAIGSSRGQIRHRSGPRRASGGLAPPGPDTEGPPPRRGRRVADLEDQVSWGDRRRPRHRVGPLRGRSPGPRGAASVHLRCLNLGHGPPHFFM